MKQVFFEKNINRIGSVMLNRLFSILNDLLVFTFVFSIFNDDFLVDHLGANILKLIFVLFFVFNAKAMYNNLKTMNLLQDKMFFMFFIMLIIVFLIRTITYMPNDLVKSLFLLLSVLFIVLFYGRYPLKKLFYFIWISMFLSIIICYFNEPAVYWTFRKSGGTGDPNTFAAGILAFIFTAIYLYISNKNRFFLVLSLMAFLYGIFFSGSKSAFLALGVVFTLLILKYLIYDLKHIFNYKFIVLILILIFSASQVDVRKIDVVSKMLDRTKKSGTAEQRFQSWRAGQHMIENHPFIGVGIAQFANNVHKYSDVRVLHPAPHNLYIRLMAESGIIVFLLFIGFLFILLIGNFTYIINSNFIWIYLSLLSLLLMGMTLGLTYHKAVWLYIAILMNINNLIYKKGHI